MTTLSRGTLLSYAEMIASAEDKNNAIECEWATGDNSAFRTWMAQYELPYSPDGKALDEQFQDAQPDAISEYGGGSAAAYWHLDGETVIGRGVNCTAYWRIPVAALDAMPEIEAYADVAEDGEND